MKVSNIEQIKIIKKSFLNKIKIKLENKNIIQISLDNPPIYQYIDEQCNEVICSINVETNKCIIDNGLSSGFQIPLESLSIDLIAYILDEIESENYEIEEVL